MTLSLVLLVAVTVLGYGLLSGKLERSILTAPMVFIGVGYAVGESGLGLLGRDLLDGEVFHFLAELTLILVLFTDASRIELVRLRKSLMLPVRMLGIALPLTIAAGMAAGLLLFPELGLWPCAILAAMLAPTDAALGQAVVSNERVPVRIRQTLNVESGLNDGFCLPPVLLFIALAGLGTHEHPDGDTAYWMRFAAMQVLVAPLAGAAAGGIGGAVIQRAAQAGWMNHAFQDLSALGLSFLAFAGAEMLGGNGFIAVFFAGLTVGNTSRAICKSLYEFGEAEGQFLALLLFVGFGAVLLPEALAAAGPAVWLYALASLSVLRMIPVGLSLIGSGLRVETLLFLGWFGPRGVASILYAMLLLDQGGDPPEPLMATVMLTVVLSAVLHGVTAYPLSLAYGNRIARFKSQDEPKGEHLHVHDLPLRLRGHRPR